MAHDQRPEAEIDDSRQPKVEPLVLIVDDHEPSKTVLRLIIQHFGFRTIVVDTAEAAISMREAEIQNAQALLISFDDRGLAAAIEPTSDDIPLYAPADGRILRVIQQSETSLPAGAPIM